MKILISGASSKIGQHLLADLLQLRPKAQIYCLTRSPERWTPPGGSAACIPVFGDLDDPTTLQQLPAVDLCIHLAGLTHSLESEAYVQVNSEGTRHLASGLQAGGCRQMIYFSSQTAGVATGAYGFSKFLAEQYLLQMSWNKLFIVRPAEVVGLESKEGLDRFLYFAQRFHLYPWLFQGLGKSRAIRFSPLAATDLVRFVLKTFFQDEFQVRIQILQGPPKTSTQLMMEVCRKYRAFPIPIPIVFLSWLERLGRFFGRPLFPPDQIQRLLGPRGESPAPALKVEVRVLNS